MIIFNLFCAQVYSWALLLLNLRKICYKKPMTKRKNSPKRFVCFGGGSAMPKVVLEPLKRYPVQITSITSMLESGGSSGQLREDLNILPPGDISRHLVALSNAPSWKKELFLMRFGREEFPDGHRGHRFGTVFIAGLEYLLKDFEEALKIAHDFLELKDNQALPATLEKTHAWAVLINGKRIKGEAEIDVPKVHDGNLKIKKVYLKPRAKAYPRALKTIEKADYLIFGPGDLYSSIIACFLPEGMKEAIAKSKVKKIFICNLMTKFGETNNFSILDFVEEIEKYINSTLDYVLYNTTIPSKERIKKYKKEHPEALSLVSINENLPKDKFIGKDLLLDSGPIEHDPKKVAEAIMQIVRKHS